MEDQNSQPDPEPGPDATRDETTDTERDPIDDPAESDPVGLPLSRRTALASLVGIGGLGLASSPAAGKGAKKWKKDRDARGNDLRNLGALVMEDNGTGIRDFAGANLAIDDSNVLNADLSGASKWNDSDGDNLLEPDSGFDGIDVNRADIQKVGASAYISGVQTIPSDSDTTVAFDATEADDFDNFDTETGKYEVPVDGDYHVAAAASWFRALDGQTQHRIMINVDGTTRARRYREVPGPPSSSSYAHDTVSKTLYGLSSSSIIDVEVYQRSGSGQDLSNVPKDTYVTIDKVG